VLCRRRLTISTKSPETALLKHLKQTILFKGPITVAEYMKQVLTNVAGGYYMNNDVFGVQGDFITSPEISQMFGELIAVWCVNEWMNSGSPNQLQIVELGPGRGTLADDMLRVITKFPGLKDAVSLHLVEVSPFLSDIQFDKLSLAAPPMHVKDHCAVEGCYKSAKSRHNSIPIQWYKHLSDVPKARSFYIAHEFFDALPIHKFQKIDGRWHEVLIDIDEGKTTSNHLRFVLAPTDTAASRLLLTVADDDYRDHIEMCPDAATMVTELSNRIDEFGGFSLIADYGHCGIKTDTFRAFRDHKLVDVLSEPGTADLTADVDFSYLKRFVNTEQVSSFGPVTQEHFLHSMGIATRLQMLFSNANDEQRKSLLTGYDMLTNPNKMGDRFKFLALMQRRQYDSLYVPAGFSQSL